MRKLLSRTLSIPLLIVPLLLIFAAVLLAQILDSKSPEPAFDQTLYDRHRACEVTTLDELIVNFEAEQARWMPVAPPSSEMWGWAQDTAPNPLPFDPSGFPVVRRRAVMQPDARSIDGCYGLIASMTRINRKWPKRT